MATTSSFIFGCIILLCLGVTTAMYLMFGVKQTISYPTAKAFKYFPIAALFVGFLIGHWVFPLSDYDRIEELEAKIVESESQIKDLNNFVKTIVDQNTTLQKIIDDLEQANKMK